MTGIRRRVGEGCALTAALSDGATLWAKRAMRQRAGDSSSVRQRFCVVSPVPGAVLD